MQIYPEYKAIYYYNSKCASTTLKAAFGNPGEPGILGDAILDPPRKPVEYYIRNYPDYRIFTFVRNPFDRVVSFYHYNNRESLKTRGYKLWNSFDEYIKEEYIFQPLFNRADGDIQLKQCIRKSKISDVDVYRIFFVGRFEKLSEDFVTICEILKVKDKIEPLGHHLKTVDRKEDYKDYYDDFTKKVISKTYQKDLDIFGYKF